MNMKKISLFFLLMAGYAFCGAQDLFYLSVDAIYDSVMSLDGRFFAVKKDGKWGVVRDNEFILDCSYDAIEVLGDDMITYVVDDKVGFADTNGNIKLVPTYPIIGKEDSYEEYQLNVFVDGTCLVYENGEYELLNNRMERVFGDSLKIVDRFSDAVLVRKDGLYGIYNTDGNEVLPAKYLSLETLIAGKLYAFGERNLDGDILYGIVNDKGEIKSDPVFTDFITGKYNDDNIYVKAYIKQGGQALINDEGELLVQPLYNVAEPAGISGFYNISKDMNWGILGKDNTLYVPPLYEKVDVVIKTDTFFVAQLAGKEMIIADNGEILFETEDRIIDIIQLEKDSINVLLERDLFYGLMSLDHSWIIEPKYDEVLAVMEDMICFRQEDKWGVVNNNGNVVVGFDYKAAKVSPTNNYIVLFDGGRKDSKLVTANGNVINFEKTESVLALPDCLEYKLKKKKVRLYLNGDTTPEDFLSVAYETDSMMNVRFKDGWTYVYKKSYERLTDKYYDMAGPFFEEGFALVVADKNISLIDNTFEEKQVIYTTKKMKPFVLFTNLVMSYYTNKGYCIIKDGDKFGVISINKSK